MALRRAGQPPVRLGRIDDKAAAFYAAFGFVPLIRRPRTLYLSVTTALSLLSP